MDGELAAGTPDAMATLQNPATSDAKLIQRWLKRIEHAVKDPKRAKAMDRMKKCQQIAAFGAFKEWLDDEGRYVVPILNRHINQAVSQLYAKNPTAETKVRKRLLNSVWDGTQEQPLRLAEQTMMGDPVAAQMLMALKADIEQAQAQEAMAKRAGETLDVLYEHQVGEQPFPYKTMLKALVRRTKVNAVGWLKVNFLRQMEMRPEPGGMAEDSTAKTRTMARLQEDLAKDDTDEVKAARLAALTASMANVTEQVVREQIVFDFPRSGDIILDPKTRHLKTLYGCNWLAHKFDLTQDQIRDVYGVDISDSPAAAAKRSGASMLDEDVEQITFCVYEVQDKYERQMFTICEGYDNWLKPPAEPEWWLESFFNVFPLVFNEIEHDEEIYPPSDVWAARHMQFEYNRSREGLREHRIAARPWWLTAKGRLGADEKARLQGHAAHEIVEVNPGVEGQRLGEIVEAGPTAGIDPNLYEVESIQTDMLRAVGSNDANMGITNGATATESSIAEGSRMTSIADNVDDLDDFLTLVAKSTGQIMLQAFSKERVMEIVGPGAIWPEAPLTKKQLADDLTLQVKAGSSGRPNQAARLANMERAWPALQMLPGINPEPLAEEYANLLDIPFERMNAPGALSIVAMNAMAGPMPAPSNDPAMQGGEGEDNAEQPPEAPAGPQPAMPSGVGPESQPLVSSVGL